MRKFLFGISFIAGVVFSGFSQEIITADRFLDFVSERYAEIRDYEARVVINSAGTEMSGDLSFLQPNFLRIDFTSPESQALIFDGELLTVYISRLRAVLTQAVTPVNRANSPMGGASMASAQGIRLLRNGYVATFVTGPDPVLLEGTSEQVVQIRLTRRLASENFREIVLSINPNTHLIRRIEARTLTNALVRFDFTNIRVNIGIPEQRFAYVPPPHANMYNNFLFREFN